jgi:hypothetical protein
MRFFSNDAKETTDDRDREHPERVQSEPVSVPEQRAGSPWSDAPAAPTDDTSDTSDAELSDQERADGTDEATDGRASFHEPGGSEAAAPGTAAATSTAGPWATADRNEAGETGEQRTATLTEERGDGGDHDAHDLGGGRDGAVDATTTDQPDAMVAADTDADHAEGDAALRDRGGFDDPKVEPVADQPGAADIDTAAATRTDTDTATATDADAAATRTDTDADAAATRTDTDTATDADAAPAGTPIPVPVGAADTAAETEPGERSTGVTEPEVGPLFAEQDAASLHERWRDVQLRFVDNPKEATVEAARLVDEAVEKLTTGLTAQREALASESDDTEQLRMELRGYRDILNRILSL